MEKLKHHPAVSEKIGVLLVNLGSPDAPTASAVRRYLAQFLADPRVIDLPRVLWLPILYGLILPFRSSRTAKLYQAIWSKEGAPLVSTCSKIAGNLGKMMPNASIRVAMCYGQPSIVTTLQAFSNEGVKKVTILPLYPQYSSTTTAAVFDQVTAYYAKQFYIPSLRFIHEYASHELYISALANALLAHWKKQGRGERLLISFHGIPDRYFDKGDPYYCFCHKTARLVTEKLGLHTHEWEMVFQSRFGKAPWLQPYCDQVLLKLAKEGVTHVDVICPGFSADCLETLEEIEVQYTELFKKAGGERLSYCHALNDSEGHLVLLKALIEGQ